MYFKASGEEFRVSKHSSLRRGSFLSKRELNDSKEAVLVLNS